MFGAREQAKLVIEKASNFYPCPVYLVLYFPHGRRHQFLADCWQHALVNNHEDLAELSEGPHKNLGGFSTFNEYENIINHSHLQDVGISIIKQFLRVSLLTFLILASFF